MKVKIIGENAKVYEDMNLDTYLGLQLGVGTELELGRIKKRRGIEWGEIILPQGRRAYILGDAEIELSATGSTEENSKTIPPKGHTAFWVIGWMLAALLALARMELNYAELALLLAVLAFGGAIHATLEVLGRTTGQSDWRDMVLHLLIYPSLFISALVTVTVTILRETHQPQLSMEAQFWLAQAIFIVTGAMCLGGPGAAAAIIAGTIVLCTKLVKHHNVRDKYASMYVAAFVVSYLSFFLYAILLDQMIYISSHLTPGGWRIMK